MNLDSTHLRSRADLEKRVRACFAITSYYPGTSTATGENERPECFAVMNLAPETSVVRETTPVVVDG